MLTNPSAPHFMLAAVKRVYPELPTLVGSDTWNEIQSQVNTHIAALEAQPNAYLASTQLFGLLAQYEPARQRLTDEMKVQEVLSVNIAEQMHQIATDLGFDPTTIDGLTAASFSHLRWEFDPETIPKPAEDAQTRAITMSDGGVGGAKSVKFKNMKLDLREFAEIAAGFVTTGFNIIDKPHPLMIAAGVLLTICALHDAMKTEFSEQEASVFWGISKSAKLKPTEVEIMVSTNAEREKYGLEPLNEAQVRHSLTKLARIKSIEKNRDTYRIVECYTVAE